MDLRLWETTASTSRTSTVFEARKKSCFFNRYVLQLWCALPFFLYTNGQVKIYILLWKYTQQLGKKNDQYRHLPLVLDLALFET